VEAQESFDLSTYYPIFLYLVFIIGFAVAALIAAHVIGPRKDTRVKLMPYESGMDPIGSARQRFDVKYYLIAIMFLVFDVELLFLYPWAVCAYHEPAIFPTAMRTPIFWSVIVFLALLAIAYLYDWKKGVFKWR
jgi:NADH-quinone oxidoreductase subunit A